MLDGANTAQQSSNPPTTTTTAAPSSPTTTYAQLQAALTELQRLEHMLAAYQVGGLSIGGCCGWVLWVGVVGGCCRWVGHTSTRIQQEQNEQAQAQVKTLQQELTQRSALHAADVHTLERQLQRAQLHASRMSGAGLAAQLKHRLQLEGDLQAARDAAVEADAVHKVVAVVGCWLLGCCCRVVVVGVLVVWVLGGRDV